MAVTFGLLNRYVDRLAARTGKIYRFVTCIAVAENENEARHLAMKNDPYGIDWLNDEEISCEPVREFGTQAPEGYISYQVIEQE